jgi:hypothetical protein
MMGMKLSIKEGKITGTSWFDFESKLIRENNCKQKMVMEIETPAPTDAQGKPVKISTDIEQNIAMQVVEMLDVTKEEVRSQKTEVRSQK